MGRSILKKKYTSLNNKSFDVMLRSQDGDMGIRDFEAIDNKCNNSNLNFVIKIPMPANNFIIVYKNDKKK